MSDNLSKHSVDPDALPVNERSSAFIEGVACLDFVRLKSLATVHDGSGASNGRVHSSAGGDATGPPNEHQSATSHSPIADQIDAEDWDSLFGAVEERLRTTIGALGDGPDGPDGPEGPEGPEAAAAPSAGRHSTSQIKAVVLDCVNALHMLHNALRQGRYEPTPPGLQPASSDITAASRLTNGHDCGSKT